MSRRIPPTLNRRFVPSTHDQIAVFGHECFECRTPTHKWPVDENGKISMLAESCYTASFAFVAELCSHECATAYREATGFAGHPLVKAGA